MDRETLIPTLLFTTLIIVLAIGIFQYFSIMKRKKMRENTPLTNKSETQRETGEGTTVRR